MLEVFSLCAPTNGLLTWLTRRLRQSGIIADHFEHFPAWKRFDIRQGGVHDFGYTTGFAMEVEPWLAAHHGFTELEQSVGRYSQACRHRIFSQYSDFIWVCCALKDVHSDPQARLHGAFPEIAGMFESYYKIPFDLETTRQALLNTTLNAIQTILVIIYLLFWCVYRLRLFAPPPRKFRLAADLLQVLRHLYVTMDMVDDNKDCLIVFRNREFAEMYKNRIEGLEWCLRTDGIHDLHMLPGMIHQIIVDCALLFRRFRSSHPRLKLRILSLIKQRIYYIGFFRRFEVEYFLGRDDYNADHIIRTDELRRRGKVSLGIAHGLPTTNRVHPDVRYLDFDIYFPFGRDLYSTSYCKSYSPETEVRAIGSIGLNRAQLELVDVPRPNDILAFASDDAANVEYIEMLYKVAEAFPQRKVRVKIKETQFWLRDAADIFVEAVRNGPENLIEDKRDSYELMLLSRYALVNHSSVAAECIYYSCITFVLDVYDRVMPHEPMELIYRDYPDLCFSSGDDIIERIHQIEDGDIRFERNAYAGLIATEVKNPFDEIRKAIGLLPGKAETHVAGIPATRQPNE